MRARTLCAAVLSLSSAVGFSQTHQTVRHSRVQEQDPVAAQLEQAESAIEKKDYSTALPLLQGIVGENNGAPAGPGANNYQAWYDLGYVYNAMGQTDSSIAAYRKSVVAKGDVFESNLNLGLMLAKKGDPEAAKFLK